MNLLNILSVLLSVVAYTCSQLHIHGKLKWQKKGHSFFGENSDLRKYKNIHADKSKFQVAVPIRNLWYYELFKIKYREAFPLSATLFTFITDFYHLAQFLFKLLLIASVVTYEPVFNYWLDFIGYFLLWGFTFTITYKFLSK